MHPCGSLLLAVHDFVDRVDHKADDSDVRIPQARFKHVGAAGFDRLGVPDRIGTQFLVFPEAGPVLGLAVRCFQRIREIQRRLCREDGLP